jgi:hypothetical protein
MEHFPRYQAASVDQVATGSFIALAIDDQNTLGLVGKGQVITISPCCSYTVGSDYIARSRLYKIWFQRVGLTLERSVLLERKNIDYCGSRRE